MPEKRLLYEPMDKEMFTVKIALHPVISVRCSLMALSIFALVITIEYQRYGYEQ